MNNCKTLPTIAANVTLEHELGVNLSDTRSDAFALFQATGEDRRAQLAEDAWIIGLRALKNAYAQAEEARLQDIGKSLL